MYREVDDQSGIAEALHNLAQIAMCAGQFEQALTMHEESLVRHRHLANQWGIARELVYLGLIHWTRGDAVYLLSAAEKLRTGMGGGWPAFIRSQVERNLTTGGIFSTAFPDGKHTIEEMIGEGDKVVARLTYRGIHTGDLMGIPPQANK